VVFSPVAMPVTVAQRRWASVAGPESAEERHLQKRPRVEPDSPARVTLERAAAVGFISSPRLICAHSTPRSQRVDALPARNENDLPAHAAPLQPSVRLRRGFERQHRVSHDLDRSLLGQGGDLIEPSAVGLDERLH
jgi:hypothetical protein